MTVQKIILTYNIVRFPNGALHSAFSQHLLQLTVTDAVFAVPAYGPQNDVTLKMPAFEWVHVQGDAANLLI
ncbi:hypothetical protein ASU74_23035 [Enterobacter hormaechei subsp. xiangfangensis]|nr:hypothetical protein ASU74_23035 [Enterobacter hormaechei subsp. xiangfangensis]